MNKQFSAEKGKMESEIIEKKNYIESLEKEVGELKKRLEEEIEKYRRLKEDGYGTEGKLNSEIEQLRKDKQNLLEEIENLKRGFEEKLKLEKAEHEVTLRKALER